MGSQFGKSTGQTGTPYSRFPYRKPYWTRPKNVHLSLKVYSVPVSERNAEPWDDFAQKELSMDITSPQGKLSEGHCGLYCLVRFLLSQHPWSPPHSLLSKPKTSFPGIPFPLQPSPVDSPFHMNPLSPVRARKTSCSFRITTS